MAQFKRYGVYSKSPHSLAKGYGVTLRWGSSTEMSTRMLFESFAELLFSAGRNLKSIRKHVGGFKPLWNCG
jgi:hypothetical protein